MIVSCESLLCKVLMLRVLLSVGLALRMGLVAWIESSSNSTLRMDFMAGTDIC